MSDCIEYKLREVVIPVKEKVDTSFLDISSYISTENMLPNKSGVCLSSGIPAGSVIKFQPGDVLISNIRPYFKKIWIANKNGGCSTDVICLRASDKINSHFLFYQLCQDSFFSYVMQGAKGTKMPRGDRNQILQWPINIPSFFEQNKIVSILKSLDDKIEVNRRINENLEQQAQALFKSWFVDFEPFKGQPFVKSELGMIPQGWNVKAFKDICVSITDGVHNSVKDDTNGDYYLLSCKNIKGGLITIGNNERKIDKETFEKLRNRTKLAKGDILLSSVGTIGEMVLLNENPSNFEFQRSVAIIKPNAELVSSHFLYYAMNAQKNEIIHSAHGAVQQCLFISDISNFKTILPSHEIMMNYTNVVYSFHDIISKNQQESRRLAELRDTLLPRLMSGELKVQNIDLINEMLKKGIR